MKKQFVYWDTAAEPITTRWYLKPLMWILSAPVAAMHKLKTVSYTHLTLPTICSV